MFENNEEKVRIRRVKRIAPGRIMDLCHSIAIAGSAEESFIVFIALRFENGSRMFLLQKRAGITKNFAENSRKLDLGGDVVSVNP